MPRNTTDDELTRSILEKIDRSRTHYYGAFVGAALLEAAGLVAYLLLADLRDRTHLLILIAAVLTYGTIAIGLVTLGTYTRWWALRIVHAVDLAKSAHDEF